MDAPAERLVRALPPSGVSLRATDTDDDAMPTLAGHFAVFNQWTEIDSYFEGRFMEQIAPGCAVESIAEDRDQIRCLFNHGSDPSVGRKVLGPFEELGEDDTGIAYEVPLLDTSYNRDLIPGLRVNQYGASFMFSVTGDSWDDEPDPSDDNPRGLPERTITKIRLYEGGPVTFPAYAGATAGLRSLTDQFSPDALRHAIDPKHPSAVPVEGRPGPERRATGRTPDQRAHDLRALRLQGASTHG